MTQNINKEALVALVATKLGGTKKAAGEAVDAVFSTVREALETPDTKVAVKGFATFSSKLIPAHEAKNNITGQVGRVAEKLKVKAAMSKKITKK